MVQMTFTFQEFLACILLEEGFMDDRPAKVINHKLKYGLDLLFCIASVMREGEILL